MDKTLFLRYGKLRERVNKLCEELGSLEVAVKTALDLDDPVTVGPYKFVKKKQKRVHIEAHWREGGDRLYFRRKS